MSASINKSILIKMANNDINLPAQEVANCYGDMICEKLKHAHPGILPSIQGNTINITNDGKIMFIVHIGDNLMVDKILPGDDIKKVYPVHSCEFYQKYWKKIVEALKHFCLDGNILLFTNNMPDVVNANCTEQIDAWDMKNNKPTKVVIKFKTMEKTSLWTFSKNIITAEDKVSKYTEEDYAQRKMAICNDPSLPSIYNEKGFILNVISTRIGIISDIDFGHHVVRLEEKKYTLL